MKKGLLISGIFIFSFAWIYGQRDLTPRNKKQAFGKRDLRALHNHGLQIQGGGTYTLTKLNSKNKYVDFYDGGSKSRFLTDPKSKLGGYIEVGMFHFPKKRSKLSLMLKTILVSYYDWGIGFKYFRGGETISVDRLSPSGTVLGTTETEGQYQSGFIYGRFSLHKNVKLKKGSHFFLDNSLGVNLGFQLIETSFGGENGTHIGQLNYVDEFQDYHGNLVAQIHYGLGFGFRVKRGAYFIPGVRIPVFGVHEWQKGQPTLNWFSSHYWPFLFHLKYMFAFEKKAKGCPPVEINDQDRNRQRN